MKDFSYLNIDVINFAPLEFSLRSGETRFTLIEHEGGFKLICSDGSECLYHSIKEALVDCYLKWD